MKADEEKTFDFLMEAIFLLIAEVLNRGLSIYFFCDIFITKKRSLHCINKGANQVIVWLFFGQIPHKKDRIDVH